MNDADRFRLLGPYRTPRFRIGQRVRCLVRGEVIITGISDAPIGWPIAKGGRGARSLVVYKGLTRAIRRESNQAVARWWGVDEQTVSKWWRLLSVPRATAGTSRLHHTYAMTDPAIIGRTTRGTRQGPRPGTMPQDRRGQEGQAEATARPRGNAQGVARAAAFGGKSAGDERDAPPARDVGSWHHPLDTEERRAGADLAGQGSEEEDGSELVGSVCAAPAAPCAGWTAERVKKMAVIVPEKTTAARPR
jgi:hypothetical protein